MEPTIERKSTRQRQMEFNNLVSIKGQKKYGWHRFFRKFLSSFFLFFSEIHSDLWLLNWFQAPRFHIEFPLPSKKGLLSVYFWSYLIAPTINWAQSEWVSKIILFVCQKKETNPLTWEVFCFSKFMDSANLKET